MAKDDHDYPRSLVFMYHRIVAFLLRLLISEGAFSALDGFFYFFEEFWYGTEGHRKYKKKLCSKGTQKVDGGNNPQSDPFSSEAGTSSPVSLQADARGEPWGAANTQPSNLPACVTNRQDAEQGRSSQPQEKSTDDVTQPPSEMSNRSMVAIILRSLISEGAFNALDGFFHLVEECWYGTQGHKKYKKKLCSKGTQGFNGGSKSQLTAMHSEATTSNPVSLQADARSEPWGTANTQPSNLPASATNWQGAEQGRSSQPQEKSTDDITQGQRLEETYASANVSKSMLLSGAALASLGEADASTAGSLVELPPSFAQAIEHGQDAAPQDAGPLPTPTTETTALLASDAADASPPESAPACPASPPHSPAAEAVLPSCSETTSCTSSEGTAQSHADTADATPSESPLACPESPPDSHTAEADVPPCSETISCTSSEGAALSPADTADASLSESTPACPISPLVSPPVFGPDPPAANSDVAPVSETSPPSPPRPAEGNAPLSNPTSSYVSNPLITAAVPDMYCALEQGGDVAEADASAAQAAGICDQETAVCAGETDARKAPACLPTQPDRCSLSGLSTSTEANSPAEGHPSYSSVATASQPDCSDGNVVEPADPEAEDSCHSTKRPGLTLDAGSFTVKSPNKDNAAAGSARVIEQLEAETAADNNKSLQPAQTPPVPMPAVLVLGAAVPAAMCASAPDQEDSSHGAAASPTGSGSQAPLPSSRRSAPVLEMSDESVDYSCEGTNTARYYSKVLSDYRSRRDESTKAQQSRDAQGSKHDEGTGPQAAAPAPTATSQRTSFQASDMAETVPSKKTPTSASAGPTTPLPPTSHCVSATRTQQTLSSKYMPQPSNRNPPLASGSPGVPATLGSEFAPTLQIPAQHSSPQASPAAAQLVYPQLPCPSAPSRATSTKSFIRAHTGADGASRMQPQGRPDAHEVPSAACPPRAPPGSLHPPGTLTSATSPKGSWACPKMSGPAAHMDLALPSMVHYDEGTSQNAPIQFGSFVTLDLQTGDAGYEAWFRSYCSLAFGECDEQGYAGQYPCSPSLLPTSSEFSSTAGGSPATAPAGGRQQQQPEGAGADLPLQPAQKLPSSSGPAAMSAVATSQRAQAHAGAAIPSARQADEAADASSFSVPPQHGSVHRPTPSTDFRGIIPGRFRRTATCLESGPRVQLQGEASRSHAPLTVAPPNSTGSGLPGGVRAISPYLEDSCEGHRGLPAFNTCREMQSQGPGPSPWGMVGPPVLEGRPQPIISQPVYRKSELTLAIGARMVFHPQKACKGGEDGYFITPCKSLFGVADGVGGWDKQGVCSGMFARQLMKGVQGAAKVVSKCPTAPFECLSMAHRSLPDIKGSCTACVLCVEGSQLHAANLGDSGFLLVRNGELVTMSRPQQHGFNCPYQLYCPGAGAGDLPLHADRYTIELKPGDSVVVATDGLLDNIFPTELAATATRLRRQGNQCSDVAKKLAELAYHNSQQTEGDTPFAVGARAAGKTWAGGKVDDITILVVHVF
ncbi:hypothetical protein ABBQ38_007773 [Trebouxia sp. C0009 RCD-2024]